MANKIFASRSAEISERESRNMNFVRSKAGECMVLLENDGTLPLKATGKIALYGNGARGTIKGGTGSGDVNSRFVVNIEQGLAEAGFEIVTGAWLDAEEAVVKAEKAAQMEALQRKAEETGVNMVVLSLNEHFTPTAMAEITEEEVKRAAAQTDTAVYVLARNSGEGTDRFNIPGDYQLTESEVNALTLLGKNFAKTIVLLNIGGIINVRTILDIEGINSLLFMSQAGNLTGAIVGDILLGKSIPTGHLSDTWAENYEDYASSANFSHNNGNVEDEYYTDGIFVGYRYFDTFGIAPAYPFGYGASYTTFDVETVNVAVCGGKVSVVVKVTNTGSEYAGKEVVQIYTSAPAGAVKKPYQVLAAFAKTRFLNPGESETLTITFPVQNMESYSVEKAAYVLEAGEYFVRVGVSSRNTRIAAAIVVESEIVTKQVKNICPLDEPVEEICACGKKPYTYAGEAEEKADAVRLVLSATAVTTQVITYAGAPAALENEVKDHVITMQDVQAGKYTAEQLVAQLTVEEMADLCVGISRDGEAGSVIGMGAKVVPGAAGDTSTLLADRGVKGMTNADGPAGLRITPHFRTDLEGNVLPGGEVFGDVMGEGFGEAKEDEIDYYQYCTAIPIASLLASGWDLELIEGMGDLVGSELEEFGVKVWLAPGMNIHRNPLCGRNFEYYSEDPLLSGLCAAADVKGAQRHPGIGTSIKHYCANNQEDNRMLMNAHIGEQALREIYLRNFAVCIRNAQPMTIMTSYNLVNGIHAANNYDTITCYAREENGFEGYVMTDWYTSHAGMTAMLTVGSAKYGCSGSPECIYAGNDVQMPGCEANIEDIIKAVNDGSLAIGYLQQCSARLLKTALMTNCYENAVSYSGRFALEEFVSVTR